MSITFTIMLFRLDELKFNNLTRVQWLKRISGQFSKGRKLRNIPTGFKHTRGDQKVRGKVLLNRIAFIDCNENSHICTIILRKLTEIRIKKM